jgi:hypothetical protein
VTGLKCPFTDVVAGSYYEKAVLWAYNAGVVKGVSETAFCPTDPISREQMATMMARFLFGDNIASDDAAKAEVRKALKEVYSDDLTYDNGAYRMRYASATDGDLYGDGEQTLIVGGYKNDGLGSDPSKYNTTQGGLNGSTNLVQIIKYNTEENKYERGDHKTAWKKAQGKAFFAGGILRFCPGQRRENRGSFWKRADWIDGRRGGRVLYGRDDSVVGRLHVAEPFARRANNLLPFVPRGPA